jgi:required for meiotic nuclear division protein 1
VRERKLDLIARTAELLLILLQNRRTLRVEWHVVALIVFEILLTIFQIWRR